MATVLGQEALDVINSLVHDRILGNVVWWNANYPANALPAWFSNLGYPSLGEVQPGHDSVVGNVDASDINDLLAYYSGLHVHIRRVRIIIYYNNNGTLQVRSDQNGVGIMNSYYGYNLTLPQQVAKDTDVTRAGFVGLCNAHYSNWQANAGNPITQTLTNTLCHTNCHKNCHSNRGRR